MKTEHEHAWLLRAIADGETIQHQDSSGRWQDETTSRVACEILNSAQLLRNYRIKPRTVRIGKYDVAAPMSAAAVLQIGTRYWSLSCYNAEGLTWCHEWRNDPVDNTLLSSGMCWLKQEDAQVAAKAISGLLKGG
jgi:hypothetical protein